MEYQIVADYFPHINNMVNELIKKGWRPHGSPMLGENKLIYQAMIKTVPKLIPMTKGRTPRL